MAKKKTPSSSFCEWIVGTTIESALGPAPEPPSQRKLFRVEISTDDESGEDTVQITYPRTKTTAGASTSNGNNITASSSSSRSSRSSRSAERYPQKGAKKVRFQESAAAPRKSAMKKHKGKNKGRKKKKSKAAVIADSETDDSEYFTSDSATDGSAATSGDSEEDSFEESSEVEVVKKKRTRKRKSHKRLEEEDENEKAARESDDGSPHPSCKCRDCARGRRKLRRRSGSCLKTASGESTTDQYDSTDTSRATIDTSPQARGKKKKHGKKKKVIIVESDSGGTSTHSFSETDTESESDAEPKKKHRHKHRNDKSKKKNQELQSETTADRDERVKNKERKKKKRNRASSKSKGKRAEEKKTYPEANPAPHPRRPNYIAPVRAEVVQTERVLETPEDPPPNAYYDAEHNIMRVYHGPVYGGNPNQSLYSKRDASKRPLPIGTPHPSNNPYFYGFNATQPNQLQTGRDQMPNPYGLPNPYRPPGMPTGAQTTDPPEFSTNQGAFHGLAGLEGTFNFAAPGGGSGNKTGGRQKSTFASYLNHGTTPASYANLKEREHGRRKHTSFYHGDRSEKDARSQDGETSGQQGAWGGGDGGGDYQARTDNTSQNNDNNQDNASGNGGGGNDDAWSNNNNDNNGNNSGWGNGDQAGDGGAGPGNGSTSDNVMPSGTMPGQFPEATAAWGDQNAAASTGGNVDKPTADVGNDNAW